jgi:hypothetical protein
MSQHGGWHYRAGGGARVRVVEKKSHYMAGGRQQENKPGKPNSLYNNPFSRELFQSMTHSSQVALIPS